MDDISWVKTTVNRRLAKGHGFYLQHAKETCLVGVKVRASAGQPCRVIVVAGRWSVTGGRWPVAGGRWTGQRLFLERTVGRGLVVVAMDVAAVWLRRAG